MAFEDPKDNLPLKSALRSSARKRSSSIKPACRPQRTKVKRRKGAQPGNTNAWRHGMYANVHPSELAIYLKEVDKIAFESRTGFSPEKNIDSARLLTSDLLWLSDEYEHPADNASWFASNFLIFRSIGSITRSIYRVRFENSELSKAFHSAPDVIYLYYYRQHGVTLSSLRAWLKKIPVLSSSAARSNPSSQGNSFQKTGYKSDQKSGGSGYFSLTHEQWAKIQPLFPNQPLNAFPRGRPRWSSRQVLDAILWKAAEGTDWESLPMSFPSQATCIRFMRSCSTDGRLPLVYILLYEDLLQRSQADLAAFDDLNEYFFIDFTHRIQVKRDISRGAYEFKTWQLNTIRLFLQSAYELIRYFRRKEKYRRFPY